MSPDVQPTFGFMLTPDSPQDQERAMYGCTRRELDRQLAEGIALYRISPAFLAMSMLSDAQEMIERIAINGDPMKERARMQINCAKYLLDTFYVTRETNQSRKLPKGE